MKYTSYAMLLVIAFLFTVSSEKTHAQTITTTASEAISAELALGSRGSNVTILQQFLAREPQIYPSGIISGYYGTLTRSAVINFQRYFGLPPVGNVGPLTRAKINSLILSGQGLDISAPMIFSPSVSTATSSPVTITWTASELARGKVFLDRTPLVQVEADRPFTEPYISGQVVLTPGTNTIQSVNLTGLPASTVFYYVIESIDMSGNVSVTVPKMFTTRM